MKLVRREKDLFEIRQEARSLGTVELYDNPCHARNCYVKLQLAHLDPACSAALFAELARIAGRPLQIMASSEDAALTAFLCAGGFERRRRCREAEVAAEAYIGPAAEAVLLRAQAGTPEYARCCETMYAYYCRTHAAVSPWTADLAAFCRMLPENVAYRERDGAIADLAFVEENEIAYVCSADPDQFPAFAAPLVAEMFAKHELIAFESDDCDPAAMRLRSLFRGLDEAGWDTWIRETE